MITVLVESGRVQSGALVQLDPAEAHHLHVRRANSGDQVRLLDGSGGVGIGTLTLGPTVAQVLVVEASGIPRPPPLRLVVGAGDRDRFAWLVEKAAELNVTDVVPMETERTAHVASRVRASHVAKLQQRAREAIKQSGAPWATVVHPISTLSAVLTEPMDVVKLVAEQGTATFPPIPPDATVTCLIGPEGGWTAPEIAGMEAAGCNFVSLSPNTLRFETAALAAAVLIQDRRAQRNTSLDG